MEEGFRHHELFENCSSEVDEQITGKNQEDKVKVLSEEVGELKRRMKEL